MTIEQPVASVEYAGEVIVIRIMYEELMSDSDILKLEDTVIPLIDAKGGTKMVLDFSGVHIISSSALGFLIRLKKTLEHRQGRLKVCCITEKVKNAANDKYIYEVFKIVKLDTFFEIYGNVDEALASFAP
jgi:anti-anti-sigma factor